MANKDPKDVPVAAKNWTNEYGLSASDDGAKYKDSVESGKEFAGTPLSSGKESQTEGTKFKDPSVKQEQPGKTEGSLAEESSSFNK